MARPKLLEKVYWEQNKPTPEEIGADYSKRAVMVGSTSTYTEGWYKVGEVDINSTYLTYNFLLSVTRNSLGIGLLAVSCRTEGTAGVLNTNISSLRWLSKPEGADIIFALDNSVTGIATLYVKVTGTWQYYNIAILSQSYNGADTPTEENRNLLTLTRNYGIVENVIVVPSITQTKTSIHNKMPASVLSESSFNAVIKAGNASSLTTGQVRNIYCSTAEPTASDGSVGDIWVVYEE